MATITLPDLVVRVNALLRSGSLAEAATLLTRCLADQPGRAEILFLLGLVVRRQGLADTAQRLMERALRVEPQFAEPHFNLALLHEEAGRFEKAEGHLRRVLTFDPAYVIARRRLSMILLSRGAVDEAARVLRRIGADGGDDDRTPLWRQRCDAYRRVREAARDWSLPAGLVVRGVFRDNSGYAYKTRQFVRHLVAAGVPVHLIDLLHQPTPELEQVQIDPLFRSLDRPVRARGLLHFTTPLYVDRLPGFKTVNYSVIETTRILPRWVEQSRRHDRVILATRSSADAWIASGCPADRIAICPEGVEAVPAGAVEPLVIGTSAGARPLASYRTRFLNVSDFNPRKNLAGLLRVWLRATSREDDAVLILKIGKSEETSRDFTTLGQRVAAETGIPSSQAAPIFIIDSRLSDEQMLSLYATGTHYWSMSHGEGWDLPMAQAGAMGLTLVAPRHSAYTAYLNDEEAHLLPASVTPAYSAYQGFDWWTPDETAAVDLIRRIIRAPDEHHRSAREHLLRNFSWEQAARRLIGLLEECGAL